MILLLEIFAEESGKLQNVYAPLPLGVHIGFCLIATALYIVLFQRRKTYNYLCLLAAVDLTLIPQFATQSAVIGTLFFVEIALLAASCVFSYKASKAKKLAAANKSHEPAEGPSDDAEEDAPEKAEEKDSEPSDEDSGEDE